MSAADDQVKGTSAASNGAGKEPAAVSPPGTAASTRSGHAGAWRQIGELIRTIRDGDDAMVEDAVIQLSHQRRIFAPLALAVGALAMLFHGLRLLLFNWRLTLVQVLPAMWIWAAMLDLKLHVLHGVSFHAVRGPVLVLIALGVVAITAPASSSMPYSPSPSPAPARRRSGRRSRKPGPTRGWCSAGAQ